MLGLYTLPRTIPDAALHPLEKYDLSRLSFEELSILEALVEKASISSIE